MFGGKSKTNSIGNLVETCADKISNPIESRPGVLNRSEPHTKLVR
jgi:hypothetical protein